jgi:membrane protease YdiL (CAAX protease family)
LVSARSVRVAELILLFAAAPWAVAAGPTWLVVPAIWLGAGLCSVILLRDPSYPRERWRLLPSRGEIAAVLLRWGAGALLLTVLIAWWRPQALFSFTRQRPALWLIVMAAYPLLSAWPQEIIFRAFFLHRYRQLFTRRTLLLASAVAFAWAHIVMHNGLAIAVCFLGGMMLARTYQRSSSIPLAAFEHGLWGDLLFTVGLGSFFYAGARGMH